MSELRPRHLAGTDFPQQDAIRAMVRETYGSVRPTDRRVAERFYDRRELAGLPDDTVRIALGVGNPVRHAGLQPGERVLDLGSGGGIDCLLAARQVGPTGDVIGVDFLPEMIDRATAAAAAVAATNVRFIRGEIEALPLLDDSVDVVVSNGVPNLSPRKVRVFAEAFRVLRPGGRLAIVDLVLQHDLYKGLRRAGFRDVVIEPVGEFGIDECALYPLFNEELLDLLRSRLPPERHDRIAKSVVVRARKAGPGESLPGRLRD